jgi:type IX secretion system PorP/SprF family membrane protein
MKILHTTYLILLLTGLGSSIKAQLNPLSAQYYTNQYLINPAFAGAGEGIKLNGAYRKLWSNVPGSPLTQSLTADYGFGKVGIGLSVNNESAGLQRQTRVVGSYAYHLQLNEDSQRLHFGVSLGFMNQRLENADIYGNPNDPMIGQYNDRRTYLDGDFGIAYTSDKLNIQASVPNLKSVLKKDVIKLADVATFYTAASYKIGINEGAEGMDVEPKVAYRGVKGFDNIWDAGAQLSIANKQVLLLGMYHSTKNATFGLGMDYKKKYLISGTYTTQTSALSNYTNGSFELNLRLNLSK